LLIAPDVGLYRQQGLHRISDANSSWLLGNSVTRAGFSEAKKKKPKLGNISASLIKAIVIGESGLSVETTLKPGRCRCHGFKA
jgi:hypothetical protein